MTTAIADGGRRADQAVPGHQQAMNPILAAALILGAPAYLIGMPRAMSIALGGDRSRKFWPQLLGIPARSARTGMRGSA